MLCNEEKSKFQVDIKILRINAKLEKLNIKNKFRFHPHRSTLSNLQLNLFGKHDIIKFGMTTEGDEILSILKTMKVTEFVHTESTKN